MKDDSTSIIVGDRVRIYAEAIGKRGDPTILLIGGATWSMDWWEDGLCHRLAECGRMVVRYDQRDTGRSTSYPPGEPDYSGADLVDDAIAVLDGFEIDRAHVVGFSMGGGVAQRLALEYRKRLSTLTLISTTPIDPGVDGLPGPTPEVQATFADDGPPPDWDDRDSVIDFIVEGERPYAGPGNFDEPRLRAIAGRVFDRSDDIEASMTNHFLLDDEGPPSPCLRRLTDLPTLVVHGTADPMFPPEHGRALAGMILGAQLVELDDIGHQLPPPSTWDQLVELLTEHTTSEP